MLDQLTQASTYRELQAALKAAKAEGYEIGCKLNAKKEVLEAARNTLVAQINQATKEEVASLAATLTELPAPKELIQKAAQILARESKTGIINRTPHEQEVIHELWCFTVGRPHPKAAVLGGKKKAA